MKKLNLSRNDDKNVKVSDALKPLKTLTLTISHKTALYINGSIISNGFDIIVFILSFIKDRTGIQNHTSTTVSCLPKFVPITQGSHIYLYFLLYKHLIVYMKIIHD